MPPIPVLVERLERLREQLLKTSEVVRLERPEGEVALDGHLHDALEDLAGWIQQAFTEAIQAGESGDRAAAVAIHLAACEANLWSATRAVFGELASEALRSDLIRLVASQPLWSEWVRALVNGLDACRTPILEANEALIAAWHAVRDESPITDRAS